MSARDEWFRSPDFGPEAMARFEARLAKSRRGWSRSQYLRIKALAVAAGSSDPQALRLCLDLNRRAIEEEPTGLNRAWALRELGGLHGRLNEPDEALRCLDELQGNYDQEQGANALAGHPFILTVELLIGRNGPGDLERARWILDSKAVPGGFVFAASRFNYHAMCARYFQAAGDLPSAQVCARKALEDAAPIEPDIASRPDLPRFRAPEARVAELNAILGGTGNR